MIELIWKALGGTAGLIAAAAVAEFLRRRLLDLVDATRARRAAAAEPVTPARRADAAAVHPPIPLPWRTRPLPARPLPVPVMRCEPIGPEPESLGEYARREPTAAAAIWTSMTGVSDAKDLWAQWRPDWIGAAA